MTQAKITPTVGRVVWFYDRKRHPGFHRFEKAGEENGPYAATIANVLSESMVSLTVSDATGTPQGFMSVPLLDAGTPFTTRDVDRWCEWMPYQKGQAAKTEAAEKALTDLCGLKAPLVLPVVDPGAPVPLWDFRRRVK